jgi:hypothetical protein
MNIAKRNFSILKIMFIKSQMHSYFEGPSWSLSYQSVPITTKVVSSNPVHGEVYTIHIV